MTPESVILPSSALTTLAGEGRETLQIPQLVISFGGADLGTETQESVPVDCLMLVRWSGSKQVAEPFTMGGNGFLYFSRKGFNTYKPRLQAAYANNQRGGTDWAYFEEKAAAFFATLAANAKKEEARLAKKHARELAMLERVKDLAKTFTP